MSLTWTDSLDIALELMDAHPDVDPKTVNFVDLQQWVLALDDFDDAPERCGERILEAIQMAWIEEAED
ncbi:MAG: Fe-S cluster assembly protein IscX [Thiotrichales bacterium]